jgi:hypothetical protein
MTEVLKQALEALELALRSHGVMLLSDPPQDAWKTYGVEGNARQAITSLRQAIAELESQEPVATVTSETGADITMSWWHEPALPVGTKLFTHPPQRTWVGLTDEEENEYNYLGPDMHWVIQEIAAKLKKKNT